MDGALSRFFRSFFYIRFVWKIQQNLAEQQIKLVGEESNQICTAVFGVLFCFVANQSKESVRFFCSVCFSWVFIYIVLNGIRHKINDCPSMWFQNVWKVFKWQPCSPLYKLKTTNSIKVFIVESAFHLALIPDIRLYHSQVRKFQLDTMPKAW